MTSQVEFLCKAAASLPDTENNHSLTILKSFYLMRCKDVTKGYGLPQKQFSSKVRCPHCCLEWKKGTAVKIRSLKLSKKQRQRIRRQKSKKGNKEEVKIKKELLQSKELEQICTLCKKRTVTAIPKLEKAKDYPKCEESPHKKINEVENKVRKMPLANAKKTEEAQSNGNKNNKPPEPKNKAVNLYSITKEVFSMNNNKNTLVSVNKQEAKVIKNNKKKKDKFAGLCQQAVLASAKLKEEKDKQNKLNLFLKPSK